MKFTFHLANCAYGNSDEARVREATRLGLICLGMRRLGVDAAISSVPHPFVDCPRWPFFRDAIDEHRRDGFHVHPAEQLRNGLARTEVAIKTSVSTARDERFIRQCRVYVAHEYDQAFDAADALLPVPFMVHDRVLSDFITDGLFQAFIDNDVETIRAHYQSPKVRLLGFCGYGWRHRKEFCENAPEWADIRFYDSHPMSGGDHCRWLIGCEAGLCLRGDTPKTNLPALLALLGIPIVWQPIDPRDTPPFTESNTIPFHSWEQVRETLADTGCVAQIVRNATDDYLNGWSHIGQAKSILERFA